MNQVTQTEEETAEDRYRAEINRLNREIEAWRGFGAMLTVTGPGGRIGTLAEVVARALAEPVDDRSSRTPEDQ